MTRAKLNPTPLLVLLFLAATSGQVLADAAIGPRIGVADKGENFFLGGQMEIGPLLGRATLVPGLDFGLEDAKSTTGLLDLRLYLLPLPETGIRIYGAAGPGFLLSPSTEVGLSLALGLHIPMKGQRRYNLEYRWSSGALPNHKVGFAVMFGL